MFYFPIIQTTYPAWFPIKSWRGDEFEFFSPVFNLADASISVGVIALLIWQKKFFPKKHHPLSVVPPNGAVLNESASQTAI
jgi:signal peptidase II